MIKRQINFGILILVLIIFSGCGSNQSVETYGSTETAEMGTEETIFESMLEDEEAGKTQDMAVQEIPFTVNRSSGWIEQERNPVCIENFQDFQEYFKEVNGLYSGCLDIYDSQWFSDKVLVVAVNMASILSSTYEVKALTLQPEEERLLISIHENRGGAFTSTGQGIEFFLVEIEREYLEIVRSVDKIEVEISRAPATNE